MLKDRRWTKLFAAVLGPVTDARMASYRSHDTNSGHADCHFGFGVSR
jgi:hypothetical protein